MTTKTLADLAEEGYEISPGGTAVDFIRYIFSQMDSNLRPKTVTDILIDYADFLRPLEEDDTLKIHRFCSPDWTWAALCGRSGWLILDSSNNIVKSKLEKMS